MPGTLTAVQYQRAADDGPVFTQKFVASTHPEISDLARQINWYASTLEDTHTDRRMLRLQGQALFTRVLKFLWTQANFLEEAPDGRLHFNQATLGRGRESQFVDYLLEPKPASAGPSKLQQALAEMLKAANVVRQAQLANPEPFNATDDRIFPPSPEGPFAHRVLPQDDSTVTGAKAWGADGSKPSRRTSMRLANIATDGYRDGLGDLGQYFEPPSRIQFGSEMTVVFGPDLFSGSTLSL